MREILFRGKNIYNDWIYGYLCQHRGEPVMDNNGMVLEGSDYYIRDWEEKIDTGFYGCNYRVDPSTIGQYTGLTDKNGKKIFEWDIVKTKFERICKVIFFQSPCYCGIDLIPLEDKHKCPDKFDLYLSDNLEIIGNIYDNPELLEADE